MDTWLPLDGIYDKTEKLCILDIQNNNVLWSVNRNISTQACQEDKGGVSESSHECFLPNPLSPFTLSSDAKDSSSSISSAVSSTDKALIFSVRFLSLVVPGIGQTSSPRWWTQERAKCDGVQPFLAAISLTCSNTCLLCSKFSGWNLGIAYNRSN